MSRTSVDGQAAKRAAKLVVLDCAKSSSESPVCTARDSILFSLAQRRIQTFPLYAGWLAAPWDAGDGSVSPVELNSTPW